MRFLEHHLLQIGVEPMRAADREPIYDWLSCRVDDDSDFAFCINAERSQLILAGASETSLDELIGEMKREGLSFRLGAPQVAYLETISDSSSIQYIHKKQASGLSEFGRLVLHLGPTGTTQDVDILVEATSLPAPLLSGALCGLSTVFEAGILVGAPVVGLVATIRDSAYHETDSTGDVFEVIARAAAREALHKGRPILLEPWMAFEAASPEPERLIAELAARRGEVGSDPDGTVIGHVPLASMFGYENVLRAITRGRGRWSMRFDGYRPVPRTFDGDGPFAPAAAMKA